MTYEVKLHKKVEKFLDTQDDLFIELFLEKVSLLSQDPYKPLQGREKGGWRLRIGKWRFKYIIIQEQVLIYFYDAGSRGDIYK